MKTERMLRPANNQYMEDKFFSAITRYNMISPGDRVLVGVSGGADSMCLIDLLYKNRKKLKITVEAAHINHCLRGSEADFDERFVSDYCAKRNIPFHLLKADIASMCKENGKSTELCAREVRYDFFKSLNFDKIATAHTGSDRIETMLMNLSRGTTLKGLCSIPPVRDNIIRPLIYFSREDTENYCSEENIKFVTDSTNLSDDYTRNKFRHNVVANLKSINPAFEKNALRCIDFVEADNDFLTESANEIYFKVKTDKGLNLKELHGFHISMQKRVVAKYFSENSNSDYEQIHVEAATEHFDADSFSFVLPSNIKINIKNGIMSVEDEICNEKCPVEMNFSKNDEKKVVFGEYSMSFCVENSRRLSPGEIAVDFYKINDIITIRSRKDGDKLSLASRHCTKTLKKLFNEEKIPRESRNCIPVVADGDGIIWCACGGIDSSRKIDKNTKKFLIIKTECGKK